MTREGGRKHLQILHTCPRCQRVIRGNASYAHLAALCVRKKKP